VIKIHIVSGFLGVGKTTLIRKLINSTDEKKVIIENEFGDIGIDGEILKGENYDVIELAQGCICCSLKADFNDTLWTVIDQYKPKHIIIEPTGIGKLSDILDAFDNEAVKNKCILTLPITVVDALEYLQQVDEFGGFFKDQISNAGIIVLSKIQLMEQDNLNEIIESIRAINNCAEIMTDDWEAFTEIEYNMLTNIMCDSNKKIRFIDEIRDLSKSFQSFGVAKPKKFSLEALKSMLDNLSNIENGKIIRAKGFVQGEDGDLQFNYVNGQYFINENKLHNSCKMCIIGSNLNKNALSRILSDKIITNKYHRNNKLLVYK